MAKPLDPPPTDNAPAGAQQIPEKQRAYMTLDTWTRLRAWLGTLRQNVKGIVNSGTASSGTSIDGLPLSGWAREGSDGISTLGPAIAMCAVSTSTQSFPTSGAYSTITTWTVQIDTVSALATSTGIYTVPVGGIYLVSYNILWNNVTYLSQGYAEVSIVKNGTQVYNDLQQVGTATASLYIDITGSYLIQCKAGDTIALQGAQDSGAANTLYANAGGLYNQFQVVKVG